ncbi:MAG: SH3 domain-containing protein [Caldilineaceae bacterium]
MKRWREVVGLILVLGLVGVIGYGPGQVVYGIAHGAVVQQPFDAAATVTALVQTREAILVILTGTPTPAAQAALSSGAGATSTAQSVADNSFRVEVKVQGLNVRSGPGTNYTILTSANAGETFAIIGEAYNCSWLYVQRDDRALGWISGAARYVAFTVPCGDLPQAPIPVAPTVTPQPASQAANNVGCYSLLNQLGFEVTITLARSDGWQDSFSLAAGAEREYCAAPGTYSYSLAAPGALGAIQGTLTIKDGERYRLPLKLGE